MRSVLSRLLAMFRREQLDRELDLEMAAHLELAERDALARGLSAADARRAARQAFGGLDGIREAHRDARTTRVLETLWRDVRCGVRAIRRTPVVCATIVLVLGVAIGANTTMFSALQGILLRPLAYGAADDLVVVMHDGTNPVSYANFDDWRRQTRSFTAMGAAQYWRVNLGLEDGTDRVLGLTVTEDMLPMLQVAPLYGRLPAADAFHGGDAKQVVIAHSLWQRRFGSDPRAIGQSLRLDGEPYTVVGVMPRHFVFAPFWAVDAELWAPLPHAGRPTSRSHNSLRIFARLAPDTSVARAQADVDAVTARLEADFPTTNRNVQVVPLKELVVGDTRLAMVVFMVGVVLVLVIACANVAHILLARGATRRREVAVRLVLGATRGQIVRQFLVESLLLAMAAAVAGIGLAVLGVRALVALAPVALPRTGDIRIDATVLMFTSIVAIVAGVGFGLAPALQAARPAPGEHLAAGRGASADRRQARIREVLMASEIALSLVLIAAAGLMVRSLSTLQSLDPGFDPQGVLAFTASVQGTPVAQPERRPLFFTDLAQRLAALPDVESASAINHLPLAGDLWTLGFTIEGRPPASPGEGPAAAYRATLPGYFHTMRLPVVRGRDFTWRDTAGAPGAAIISDNLARRHWPGEEALGQRIALGDASGTDVQWMTVVGVVADAVRDAWGGGRGEELYVPYLQTADYLTSDAPPFSYLTFVLRSRSDRPGALVAAAQGVVASLDRGVAVSDVETMPQVVARELARPRLQLTLLALCAVIALMLAAAGIYGLVSYAVARRSREIGLRMALGAQRGEVRRMVVGQSLRRVAIGVVAGLIGALALTRLMASLLYGVQPADPATFVVSTLLLIGVAALASSVPAWRASRIEPVVALREE